MTLLSLTHFLNSTLIATASSALLVAGENSASTLTVTVSGLQHQNSQICLRVFANERGFPLDDRGEVHSECTETTKNSVTMKIPNLQPGTYAVAVVDDLNRDYQLNRNSLGIPQEGFGISNNPQVSIATGLPKFDDASFLLQENQAIEIAMKYALDF
ncbi:DUF2141 domain-containing protein [Pleurocapsales cyanobacterium LEGE 10410]|nr:DUF2141 domain-containing protein [Pleurocapsales cyanobacterium LEGE 10410]